MSETLRQDASGEPYDNGAVPGEKWVNTSTSLVSTTTRTDRGSEGEEPTVTEVTMVIHQPKKELA